VWNGAGTARPGLSIVFANDSNVLNYTSKYTTGGRAMWTMSTAQALIFVAAVVIAVALLLAR
jgi:hypothetical protein